VGSFTEDCFGKQVTSCPKNQLAGQDHRGFFLFDFNGFLL
jgi:hypothetical protein